MMPFDVQAARQAISRVKERSIGPTTVTDLAELLAAATAVLAQREEEVTRLRSMVRGVQEQAEHAIAQANLTLDHAKAERAAAETHAAQTGQIVELVTLLETAAQSLERTTADADSLRSERLATEMRAQAQTDAALAHVGELEAERVRLVARDAQQMAVLERIASMSWWDAMRRAVKAAEDIV